MTNQDVSLVASAAAVLDAVCGGRAGLGGARLIADRMAEVSPPLVAGLRSVGTFVNRAVVQAADAGIMQFVQIGCGFPGVRMLHEVAGRGRSGVRVVYADEDPTAVGVFDVLTMGLGAVACVVTRWCSRLASRSWVVMCHPTEGEPGHQPAAHEAAEVFRAATGTPLQLRTQEGITQLLSGLDVQPPGLVPVNYWRPALVRGQPVPVLGAIAMVSGARAEAVR